MTAADATWNMFSSMGDRSLPMGVPAFADATKIRAEAQRAAEALWQRARAEA